MQPNEYYNIERLRRGAMRVLPRPIFDYIDGGSDDEIALRRSTTAFDDIEFLPRSLVDISNLNTASRFSGNAFLFPCCFPQLD